MLTPAATGLIKKTFLLQQPLFQLQEPEPDARWQAVVNEAEPRDEARKQNFTAALRPPRVEGEFDPKTAWHRLDRLELTSKLADPPAEWRRVALVCGAGLGKTTTLTMLERFINEHAHHHGKQLAFFLELKDLPCTADELLDCLTDRMHNRIVGSRERVQQDLKRRRCVGRITLLLDSLDQAGPKPDGSVLKALNALLKGSWSNCPIWVSGRPHAFKPNRPLIMENADPAWKFVRVGQLDEPEARQLLDEVHRYARNQPQRPDPPLHLYSELSPAAQRLAGVPRIGWLIGRLSPESLKARLSRNATEADVFWLVYNFIPTAGHEDCGVLLSGLKAKDAQRLAWRLPTEPDDSIQAHQVRRARDLLGAIAFELLSKKDEDGKPAPAFNGVEGFKKSVRKRFIDTGALVDINEITENPQYFDADWKALLAMDSVDGLKHFIFSTNAADDELRWGDITTMAFFAAYWACRWATDVDRKAMCSWVIDPIRDTNEEFLAFWRFAAGMPTEAIDAPRWKLLFSPFYDGSLLAKESPIRSTEFIYRSWDRMKGTEVQENFLREFQAIRALPFGERRERIASNLLIGFIRLGNSGMRNDTGTFLMGSTKWEHPLSDTGALGQDNPQHPTRLTTPFLLHAYCVSNEQYELFDPMHKNLRWWYGQRNPFVKDVSDEAGDDECPVVMVSWYDAWCFAKWLGMVFTEGKEYEITLPTEAQWEYACRGGEETAFTFAAGTNRLPGRLDSCNFDGNYPYPQTRWTAGGVHRGHTLPIRCEEFEPNTWGFWQMHGNVREWCLDWYSRDFYGPTNVEPCDPVNLTPAEFRVRRGGGWNSPGWLCRSAYRDFAGPIVQDYYCGFRLAAVPCLLEPS